MAGWTVTSLGFLRVCSLVRRDVCASLRPATSRDSASNHRLRQPRVPCGLPRGYSHLPPLQFSPVRWIPLLFNSRLPERPRTPAHDGVLTRTPTHWVNDVISSLPRLGSRVRIPSPAPIFPTRSIRCGRGRDRPGCCWKRGHHDRGDSTRISMLLTVGHDPGSRLCGRQPRSRCTPALQTSRLRMASATAWARLRAPSFRRTCST